MLKHMTKFSLKIKVLGFLLSKQHNNVYETKLLGQKIPYFVSNLQ